MNEAGGLWLAWPQDLASLSGHTLPAVDLPRAVGVCRVGLFVDVSVRLDSLINRTSLKAIGLGLF